MIVEDQLENRLLLRRLLESVGFEVIEAINGQQGIEQFKQCKPDFIWMDRRMPVMDGITATHKIRELPKGKDTPIVAVTASVFEQERYALLQAGVNEIVNKPFRDDDIFHCMEKYLNIKFLYKSTKNTEKPQLAQHISEEEMNELPLELINQLAQAAGSLDIELTEEVIAKVRELKPELADGLTRLVDNFNFEKIVAMTEFQELK